MTRAALTLGNRLQLLRCAKGWSTHELARRTRTPVNTVHDWETDTTHPTPDQLTILRVVFGVTLTTTT